MSRITIDIKDKSYTSADGQVYQAISQLKFSLPKNRFTCLVGPSGCGKTTLLNIISQLDTDFRGVISLDGNKKPSIGYIFQNPRLLPWHTVRENIELVLNDKTSKDKIDFLLDTMQLTKHQHTYPEHLSLGMSRRVAIIRAFSINPDILLMDEPFVSLDAPTARQARELLLNLWQQRPHTVLFVTHDLREAIALADQLIFLSASPTSVVNAIDVTIPRSQRSDEKEIENFRQHLLTHYPEIKSLL
ncbi:MAG: ABC transporter ATP-binding protein [Methylococcales bacterium]|nr:ABC transporter ATP-binding protein [Methylococcales bacterium]